MKVVNSYKPRKLLMLYFEGEMVDMQDAVLISKCIESLQTLMDALIKEGSFWSQEASKMEQHLMDEERIFQESRICWEEKIRKLQDKFVSNYNDA